MDFKMYTLNFFELHISPFLKFIYLYNIKYTLKIIYYQRNTINIGLTIYHSTFYINEYDHI